MATWQKLTDELDRWADLGQTATFWWRDDDATDGSPALARLFALTAANRIAFALAVIPKQATGALVEAVRAAEHVRVIQHGYAHDNHAPPEAKKIEIGGTRSLSRIKADLARGLRRAKRLFGNDFRPVMVPPWNRIEPAVVPILPAIGFHALSCFGPRPAETGPIARLNTHVDPIDWRGTRLFAGEAAALTQLLDHLGARRDGRVQAEPTGLLTHHTVMDEPAWRFAERLAAAVGEHPAARWISCEMALEAAR